MLPIDERRIRQTAVFCHLAAFAGIIIPFASLGAPLAIWLIKRGDDPFVDAHGREAVNFQLSLLLYLGALTVVGFATTFALMEGRMDGARITSSPPPLLYAAFGLIGIGLLGIALVGLVCPINAALRADKGEAYRYPLSMRLVR